MGFDEHEDEDGYYDGPEDFPTREEIKEAVQVLLFLEHEMGIDVKRIRVRVRNGVVHVQGSVASHEQRRDIERQLPTRPNVKQIAICLSVDASS